MKTKISEADWRTL